MTFNDEEGEDTLVEEVTSNVNAAWCFTGTHATVRFTKESIRDQTTLA